MIVKNSRTLLRAACLLAIVAALAVSVTSLSPKSYYDRENIENVEEFMDDEDESAQQYHPFNPLSWLNTEAYEPSTILQSQTHRQLGSSSSSSKKHHKPLLPLDHTDKLGLFFATLGLMIAAGGGIGGGGVLVPIYILVMKFSPKHAIPLSNITVFGGAIANTILNIRKRHPLTDRPLVDWDLILVMEPLTIAGALIGAILNKLLPEALLVISLVALLSFTAYNTLKKAVRMYKAETRAMRLVRESELTRMARKMEEEDEEEEETESLLDEDGEARSDIESTNGEMEESGDKEDEEEGASNGSRTSNQDDDNSVFSSAADLKNKEELNAILEEDRHIPMGNVKVLVVTFVVILFINLMKGGGAFPSPLGIRCGSPSFWVSNGVMLGWILLVSIFARMYLVRRHEIKERVGYPYVEGDIKWDSRATVVYPLVCTAAGFFAGMFGVGGGIVKGPLMLAMGVHPKVSSASSACMILFTSFTATTSFVVFGLLDMEYAVICMSLGFTATLVGQIGLFYLMEKFQRNSYIAFSIGGIVLLSAILMTIQSLISMADRGGPSEAAGLCAGKQ
eukprot:CAMPEP_0201726150 /NCGR_PEP_ID=MMETSP0593-20130828/9294_1 /ASSEMBLY_ACC=CAM_ASM_000672 /TAXON_ID=267983 /ORGANISM="Skeletonema japonicum, Strain CCMP2506" /LENGTH=564 /DNA_ID=CAMNT_0048217619 /DNA_START=38 /DNA_END=1732 /DNA_ORIENTATION=+